MSIRGMGQAAGPGSIVESIATAARDITSSIFQYKTAKQQAGAMKAQAKAEKQQTLATLTSGMMQSKYKWPLVYGGTAAIIAVIAIIVLAKYAKRGK